ncbi:pentapeptide repeat-containing protein [Actinosynnema sp. NPDC050436]|uniref:pentapeptide repeat-containing protein n=1 Tax=Actinosynnema sp. NPDC050436 TaxID=3155659 RepID=UPI0033F255B9
MSGDDGSRHHRGRPTAPWRPRRWPASPEAAGALRTWLDHHDEGFFGVDLDLRDADLSGGPFVESWFSGADLCGADLRGAVLRESHCEQAAFVGADLTGATLVRACLLDARLGRAVLTGADLTRADLTGATVDETSLRGAKLCGAAVRGMSGSVRGPVEVEPGARLDGLDLELWFALRGADVSVPGTAG